MQIPVRKWIGVHGEGYGREGLDPKDKEDNVPIGLQGGLGVSPLANLSLGSVS